MEAKLVFAVYLEELKGAWNETISEPDLVNLLYDAISEPAGLLNRRGETITVSKGTASKIFKRLRGGNVNQTIRKHSHDSAVIGSIDHFFETKVVKRLLHGSEINLIHRLDSIIQEDETIAPSIRNELHELAQKNAISSFLAKAYIQSLQPKNVLETKTQNTSEMNKDDAKHHPLQSETPSDRVQPKERRYTNALMDVYAEDAQIPSMTEYDLNGKYNRYRPHFTRQRGDYFAAEAIRRGTRDFYGDDEEEYFTILENEIYNGIIDVWENPSLSTGFDRLRATLEAAMHAPVDQCWIARDTVWVGNSQKKGVCHVLVNEGKLEGWVNKRASSV